MPSGDKSDACSVVSLYPLPRGEVDTEWTARVASSASIADRGRGVSVDIVGGEAMESRAQQLWIVSPELFTTRAAMRLRGGHECPLWVKSGHSPPVSPMTALPPKRSFRVFAMCLKRAGGMQTRHNFVPTNWEAPNRRRHDPADSSEGLAAGA